MRYFKITLMSLFLLAAPALVLAQDPPKEEPKVAQPATAPEAAPATPAAPAAATPAVEHKATGTVEHLEPDATTEEVLEAAFTTVEEAKKYFKDREDGTKKAFAWAMALAALLNLLIALIRRTSPFWKKTRGKWVIRLITLTLGVAAGIVSNLAIGMPWWDAVVVFIGGPGAVLIAEYKKMIPFLNPKKEEK